MNNSKKGEMLQNPINTKKPKHFQSFLKIITGIIATIKKIEQPNGQANPSITRLDGLGLETTIDTMSIHIHLIFAELYFSGTSLYSDSLSSHNQKSITFVPTRS